MVKLNQDGEMVLGVGERSIEWFILDVFTILHRNEMPPSTDLTRGDPLADS